MPAMMRKVAIQNLIFLNIVYVSSTTRTGAWTDYLVMVPSCHLSQFRYIIVAILIKMFWNVVKLFLVSTVIVWHI